MMRAGVLKKFKYSEKYKHAEDYYLWFKIARGNKVFNIQEFLMFYRVHGQSDSHQNGKKQHQNALALISDELDKTGIEYTPNELSLHIAINAGYGSRYFNSPQKIKELHNWVDKILSAIKDKYGFSKKIFQQSKDTIFENYCGINN